MLRPLRFDAMTRLRQRRTWSCWKTTWRSSASRCGALQRAALAYLSGCPPGCSLARAVCYSQAERLACQKKMLLNQVLKLEWKLEEAAEAAAEQADQLQSALAEAKRVKDLEVSFSGTQDGLLKNSSVIFPPACHGWSWLSGSTC